MSEAIITSTAESNKAQSPTQTVVNVYDDSNNVEKMVLEKTNQNVEDLTVDSVLKTKEYRSAEVEESWISPTKVGKPVGQKVDEEVTITLSKYSVLADTEEAYQVENLGDEDKETEIMESEEEEGELTENQQRNSTTETQDDKGLIRKSIRKPSQSNKQVE